MSDEIDALTEGITQLAAAQQMTNETIKDIHVQIDDLIEITGLQSATIIRLAEGCLLLTDMVGELDNVLP